FSQARLLYFAADALVWLPDRFSVAEDYAGRAVEAYSDPADPDWAFGDAAGSRTNLAVARIGTGEVDGAAEALTPVLDLPAEQRINGIVQSVNRVHRALSDAPTSAVNRDLQERIELYTRTPLRALAR
ncbi:MAG: hypothetical protein LC808_18490, partial [Actinobacteria bacterium]|nr:hypothetical protein [Actinomycetota bacterium]